MYELKKTFDHIIKNYGIFTKYFQDQLLQRYVEKMRLGNTSGGKLEIIRLNSLFQINIKSFHFLTQERPQLVVKSNFEDKQVNLFKEDNE